MSNIFSRIATLFNRIADVVSQGNLERVRIIKEFNLVFKEAFSCGDIDRLCSVTTSPGNPQNKHALSVHFLRSGFKITIHNDEHLTKNDFVEISKYVIDSAPFVRQLMSMGYDTLIIKGMNYSIGLEIPLNEIANLYKYMLK
jgi:hypothetical protein